MLSELMPFSESPNPITFTFIFIHFADTFSDLQGRKANCNKSTKLLSEPSVREELKD